MAKQVVDQEFHRIGAIAHRGAAAGLRMGIAGQEEMIHPAHGRARIPEAGGDARSENRAQDGFRIVFDPMLALHDVDAASIVR
ncbi:hypothetical protein Apmu_0334_03 [Acidiphilium multivorum AIU301]|nr:hypothetical protein Apmu_0334_03 [Acidiphilium multivorum AIU301]